MISISGLHKAYGKNKVLKGIDLDIPDGAVTAVLGPNGSGKTTLIKSILGMVVPQKGNIKINGEEIMGKYEYRNDLGYLPQIARFPENLKVSELIGMVRDIRKIKAQPGGLLRKFALESYIDTSLRHLSGGTRQKINILLAFMFDSRYYILDEPTTGLDPVALLTFKEMITAERGAGKTILLTTHIISLVDEIADFVVFILDGKIYFKGKKDKLGSMHGGEGLEKAIAGILMKNGNV